MGKVWGDPIHLTDEGYEKIAVSVSDATECITGGKRAGSSLASHNKRARTDEGSSGSGRSTNLSYQTPLNRDSHRWDSSRPDNAGADRNRWSGWSSHRVPDYQHARGGGPQRGSFRARGGRGCRRW